MGNSWKIGRVAGIDLFLHPTFLLLMAFGLWNGVDYALLLAAVFGCVVLHELGHALTARGFGIGTRDITLWPIGGVASLDRIPRAPGAELLITLAGPLVNVAIAAALWTGLWIGGAFDPWATGGLSYLETFAADLMTINLVLAAFNMIPAFPMDGGRVLRASLAGPLGHYRATEIAAGVGRFAAVGLGVYGLLNGHFMLAILAGFVFLSATGELVAARAEEARRRWIASGDGIAIAPPGFRYESRGNGFWQLVPIRVEARPWR